MEQYYATINPDRKLDEIDLDPGSVRMSHDEEDQPIAWLSNDNIEETQESVQNIMGIEGMLGSGQMVGGIVNERIEHEEVILNFNYLLNGLIPRCLVGNKVHYIGMQISQSISDATLSFNID